MRLHTMKEGICKIDSEKMYPLRTVYACLSIRSDRNKIYITHVIEALKSDKKVYAMAAPATEGQFGKDITMNSWKKAMQEVGFDDFIEVGLGGDMTAAYEAEEWAEAYKEGKKMTTSCCPAFVNMIDKHFPELKDNVSTTVSPMCAVSRWIKSQNPDAVTVFIGPCVAKEIRSDGT